MSRSRKRDNSGTGMVVYNIDIDKRIINIDLSGECQEKYIDANTGEKITSKTVCYLNRSSIFFFSSKSYYVAFNSLINKVESLFKNGDFTEKDKAKIISRYILPLNFNFRQFVENKLKAFIFIIREECPLQIHNLENLLFDLIDGLNHFSHKNRWCYEKDIDFIETIISDLKQSCEILLEKIKLFENNEGYSEFYRYILNKEFECKNKILKYNHNEFVDLTNDILQTLNNFEKKASKILYIYNNM